MTEKKQTAGTPLLPFLTLLAFMAASVLSPLEAADPQKKLSEIQKQLKSTKQKVQESIKEEKNVLGRIEDIDTSINQKTRELRDYDKRITSIQSQISSLTSEVEEMNGKLTGRQNHLNERLRALYKQQYGGHALVLISAKDYQDLLQKSRYISLIAHYDRQVIDKYGSDIKEIIIKKRELEGLTGELKSQKDEAEKVQKALETDRVKKDRLLAMIRSKRQAYEKTVKELEESSRKLRDMISSLKTKALPASITGKGFNTLKGRLHWPVGGRVVIPYGKYEDPEYKIPVFKNGIEIRPNQGEKPTAIAGGRVVYADWFKGYGLLLIIDHGSGYHSLYGNLSEIFLDAGDILIDGTVIGKIGNSSLLDYPTLYFEIRYKGKPVDPVEWLARAGSSGRKVRIK